MTASRLSFASKAPVPCPSPSPSQAPTALFGAGLPTAPSVRSCGLTVCHKQTSSQTLCEVGRPSHNQRSPSFVSLLECLQVLQRRSFARVGIGGGFLRGNQGRQI